MESKIISILKELGIPMGNLGFGYIVEAVNMVAEDKKNLQSMTKMDGLYYSIAKRNDTKGTRVERAIRHAIEGCFLNCSSEVLYKYFGCTADIRSGKLTNRNFIATLANEVVSNEKPVTPPNVKQPNVQEGTVNPLSDYTIEELMRELFSRIKN